MARRFVVKYLPPGELAGMSEEFVVSDLENPLEAPVEFQFPLTEAPVDLTSPSGPSGMDALGKADSGEQDPAEFVWAYAGVVGRGWRDAYLTGLDPWMNDVDVAVSGCPGLAGLFPANSRAFAAAVKKVMVAKGKVDSGQEVMKSLVDTSMDEFVDKCSLVAWRKVSASFQDWFEGVRGRMLKPVAPESTQSRIGTAVEVRRAFAQVLRPSLPRF